MEESPVQLHIGSNTRVSGLNAPEVDVYLKGSYIVVDHCSMYRAQIDGEYCVFSNNCTYGIWVK